jgi:hypothetical protein
VYAGAAVCAPSRSVLMTGLHTGHTAAHSDIIARIEAYLAYARHGRTTQGVLSTSGEGEISADHALEVFSGADPPNERIIRTRTFVDSIAALSDYLARR